MMRATVPVLISCVLILGGCSTFTNGANEQRLYSVLHASVPAEYRWVDLDGVIQGEWTDVVLVCDHSSGVQINDALGFDWANPAVTYHSMFLFSTGSSVESTIDSGDTTASKEPWLYPCTPPGIQEKSEPNVVQIPRDLASLRFTYDDFSFVAPLWYVSGTAVHSGAQASSHEPRKFGGRMSEGSN